MIGGELLADAPQYLETAAQDVELLLCPAKPAKRQADHHDDDREDDDAERIEEGLDEHGAIESER